MGTTTNLVARQGAENIGLRADNKHLHVVRGLMEGVLVECGGAWQEAAEERDRLAGLLETEREAHTTRLVEIQELLHAVRGQCNAAQAQAHTLRLEHDRMRRRCEELEEERARQKRPEEIQFLEGRIDALGDELGKQRQRVHDLGLAIADRDAQIEQLRHEKAAAEKALGVDLGFLSESQPAEEVPELVETGPHDNGADGG